MTSSVEKLAVDGGPPVRDKMLPYGRQWLDEEDISAVVEVLRSDWLTTGPKVAEFEHAFAESVGAREAVAVRSAQNRFKRNGPPPLLGTDLMGLRNRAEPAGPQVHPRTAGVLQPPPRIGASRWRA